MLKIKTDTEFMEVSKHLYHEIQMFNTIVGAVSPLNDQFKKNLLIESFGIHSRNLIKFFYDKFDSNDDIVAHNFILSIEDWTNARPIETKLLKDANKRSDKEIINISHAMINQPYQKSDWEFVKIFQELKATIKVFFRFVPDEKLCSEMIQLRERYR
jgi:hypothetical protein